MNVTLINYTSDAVALLLFTKATRLSMTPALLEEIRAWPEERKSSELAYMAKTIKSSWEFLDVTFLIEGVSRAAAQQITRTRTASYAMQSQRVNDARSFGVTNALPENTPQRAAFEKAVRQALNNYASLVDAGVPLEDARGVLPMNSQCNLVAKYNLRSLSDVIKTRKSLRAQGEYANMARAMEVAVLAVWPWAKAFFASDKQIAITMLEGVAKELGVTPGKGQGWEIAKAIDLIQKA